MKKYAVISLDFEDWYHLDYFNGFIVNKTDSLINEGVNNYLEILDKNEIKSNVFIVGELIKQNKELIKKIISKGHNIGAHSSKHIKPLDQNLKEFSDDALMVYNKLHHDLKIEKFGYRAPCFSLDRKRLDIIKKIGFSYDSSKISVGYHPLYGKIDTSDFKRICKNVFRKDNFYEFELSVHNFLNKKIPISGGGYLRIIPWFIYRKLLKEYLKNNHTYFFFIHPFELTNKAIKLPSKANFISKRRFSYGRKNNILRFDKLLNLVKNYGYEFVTFEQLIQNYSKNAQSS